MASKIDGYGYWVVDFKPKSNKQVIFHYVKMESLASGKSLQTSGTLREHFCPLNVKGDFHGKQS